MLRTALWLCVLGTFALVHPGCGVILGYGGPQPVKVITNPPGGKLTVDALETSNIAPCEILLEPKLEHQVQAKLDDGSAGSRSIGKTVRIPVVVLDGILTLGIGLLVDYFSGAMYQLDTPVTINMGKAPPRPERPPPVQEPPPNTTEEPQEEGKWITHLVTGERVFVPDDAAPCEVCGESRGEIAPCPYCGMD